MRMRLGKMTMFVVQCAHCGTTISTPIATLHEKRVDNDSVVMCTCHAPKGLTWTKLNRLLSAWEGFIGAVGEVGKVRIAFEADE